MVGGSAVAGGGGADTGAAQCGHDVGHAIGRGPSGRGGGHIHSPVITRKATTVNQENRVTDDDKTLPVFC